MFGLRRSPAILASTIRHHLDSQVSEEFKPHFIELLKKSLYVDNLFTGEGDEAKALELCSKSKSLTQRGGFNLRKWKTNSKIVQEAINGMNDRANPITEHGRTKTITEEDESYQRLQTDLQLRLAVPPKTQSLKYWAQFGTLTPTGLCLTW